MSFNPADSIEEFDPVTFELASGDLLRVSFGLFWSKVSESDRRLGIKPYQYLAIRIYGNEESYPRRLQLLHELFQGKDFAHRHCAKIWQWLLDHISSRDLLDHENTDDFLAHFESVIDKIQAEDEDMIEHLERLPSYTLPEAFDRIDDSIFTDQTDPELT